MQPPYEPFLFLHYSCSGYPSRFAILSPVGSSLSPFIWTIARPALGVGWEVGIWVRKHVKTPPDKYMPVCADTKSGLVVAGVSKLDAGVLG